MIAPFAFIKSSGAAAPAISSLNYSLGDTAGGGQSIVVTGTNLGSASAVTIGGNSATITGNTSTTVTFTLPAHAAGSVTVSVTTAGGTSGTLAFEYWTPAQMTGIDAYLDSGKGITHSVGAVSAWLDQSSNARNFVQATGGNKPTLTASVFGTLDSVRFVQNKWVRLASAVSLPTARSVFWVGKWTSSDSTDSGANVPLTVLGDAVGSYTTAGASAGALAYQQYLGGTTTRGSSLNDGSTRLVGWTHSAAGDLKAYVSGVQSGATATGIGYDSNNGYNSVGVGYGDVDGFIGDLGAVISVNQVADGGDMTKLTPWAQQRFGAA